MATTRISLESYLERMGRHGFHEEFVDGEIQEKPVGGNSHAAWMMAIAAYFHRHRHEWGVRALPDLHVNVRGHNYRIADVAIVDRSVAMDGGPLREAPVAVFEILSPTDSDEETVGRLRDYEAMGTPLLSLLDPKDGVFKRYSAGEMTAVSEFSWPERNIRFPFAEMALELD